MCRPPAPFATAAVLLALAGPAAAWPLGPSKPPAKAAAAATPAAQKASPAERAAADRLDPLSRSTFWAHEVEKDPADAEAGVRFATALRTLGRYQEAGEAADKVLVLHPDDIDALLEKARASVAAGKGFYALEPLRHAQTLAPRDWRIYSLQAVAHDQNQQPDAARAAYGQALALAPENPSILSNLGLWYASHGQRGPAETYLRRAAAEPGATPQVRQNLALVLGMEGKLGEAEGLMREDLPPEIAAGNLAYLRSLASP